MNTCCWNKERKKIYQGCVVGYRIGSKSHECWVAKKNGFLVLFDNNVLYNLWKEKEKSNCGNHQDREDGLCHLFETYKQSGFEGWCARRFLALTLSILIFRLCTYNKGIWCMTYNNSTTKMCEGCAIGRHYRESFHKGREIILWKGEKYQEQVKIPHMLKALRFGTHISFANANAIFCKL